MAERGFPLRMRYRVSTHFNWYAGRVADFLIADFADMILRFYSRRAEALDDSGRLVTDRDDRQHAFSAGNSHRHFVIERLAHERARERRIHADVAGDLVELIGADDAV